MNYLRCHCSSLILLSDKIKEFRETEKKREGGRGTKKMSLMSSLLVPETIHIAKSKNSSDLYDIWITHSMFGIIPGPVKWIGRNMTFEQVQQCPVPFAKYYMHKECSNGPYPIRSITDYKY